MYIPTRQRVEMSGQHDVLKYMYLVLLPCKLPEFKALLFCEFIGHFHLPRFFLYGTHPWSSDALSMARVAVLMQS